MEVAAEVIAEIAVKITVEVIAVVQGVAIVIQGAAGEAARVASSTAIRTTGG